VPGSDEPADGVDQSEDPTPSAESSEVTADEGVASKKLAWLAVGLSLAYLLVTFVDVWWAGSRATDASAPAAVVLGAAQYNGEPSAVLQARLDRAAELWLDERVGLVVVTGGGQDADITTEAKTGYDYLRETAGLDDADLRLEVQGSSTYESLAAASRFLNREGITEVILVTDPYHARRAQLIAEEVGLDASVYPTDSSSSFDRLLQESAAVALGRIISFRRIDNYLVG
jgi:uncharacterized SAM-binding protein YcdF (DUF218 family)